MKKKCKRRSRMDLGLHSKEGEREVERRERYNSNDEQNPRNTRPWNPRGESSQHTRPRANIDPVFTSAPWIPASKPLLLAPSSVSDLQNYSQPTASNLSFINKTQHSSVDNFLKL